MAGAVADKHRLLSAESQAAVRASFQGCLQRVLPGGANAPAWSVAAVPGREAVADREFVMLTISAYSFRVIVLLHFTLNEAIYRLAADLLKTPREKVEESRARDCLNELGNNFCGELKRELSRVSPHLGMSTPNRLGRANLAYVGDLCSVFDAHVRALHQDQPVVAASLYVCTYGEVDFRPLKHEPDAESESASTLELF
jgi:hypothetical protein